MMDYALLNDVRHWMMEKALPFWSTHGPDCAHGGFIEELSFDGLDAKASFKRTRVTCRQIYVFSHAKQLGWSGADDLIEHGVAYLTERAWMSDDHGFARTLTRQSHVLDPTPDLYDHAFAVFAFAWAYRATGKSGYRQWLYKVFDFIQSKFQVSDAPGFWHHLPPTGFRQQNPHMHLLEACLVAFEATSDERYRECCAKIVALFEDHFFDLRTGALGEYFSKDLSVPAADEGQIVEPGHQFEWVWLLHQASKLMDRQFVDPMRALFASAEERGIGGHGGVLNKMKRRGEILDGGSRCWPNTERLKGAIALAEIGDQHAYKTIDQTTRMLMTRYISGLSEVSIPAGAWNDAIDKHGRATSSTIPASTFYHIFLAFAELMRLAGALPSVETKFLSGAGLKASERAKENPVTQKNNAPA